MTDKTFFITTAIDYTNASPHIGHAYEKVLADSLARFHRLAGRKVFFLTGVDQHGQKVAQSAAAQGVKPLEFAEGVTQRFLSLWETLGISNDGWAATTSQVHKRVVQAVLQKLFDQGELYKARHVGHYSIRQEQFLTDKERGPDGHFGPEWGEVVELEEENWYFPLAKHREWLLGFIQKSSGFVTPEFRKSEVLHSVEKMTGDLCISRPKERLSWGIEFPFDSNFVTYVWFDALINYLSFAGYLKETGDPTLPDFEDLWPCDAHVIGKDIMIPSHSVYWPIMLKGMGFADHQMPHLLVHGWWNVAGAKMSKSTGNVVDPVELASRYGASGLRYFLLRDIVTGQDSDFSEQRIRARYAADLANDLGNLLNRSLKMAHSYLGGKLRDASAESSPLADLAPVVLDRYIAAMQRYEVHLALEALWDLVSAANSFVETSAPWKLAKMEEEKPRLEAVIYHLLESLRVVSVLVDPVMPVAAQEIRKQLNWKSAPGDAPKLRLNDAEWGGLQDGHLVNQGVPIFPRLEEKTSASPASDSNETSSANHSTSHPEKSHA